MKDKSNEQNIIFSTLIMYIYKNRSRYNSACQYLENIHNLLIQKRIYVEQVCTELSGLMKRFNKEGNLTQY